jgi:hypothetical protein
MSKFPILSKLQALPKWLRIVLFFAVNILIMKTIAALLGSGDVDSSEEKSDTVMWVISGFFIGLIYILFFPRKRK